MFEILQNKVLYENFQKTKFQRKKMVFCENRTHDPWVMRPVLSLQARIEKKFDEELPQE